MTKTARIATAIMGFTMTDFIIFWITKKRKANLIMIKSGTLMRQNTKSLESHNHNFAILWIAKRFHAKSLESFCGYSRICHFKNSRFHKNLMPLRVLLVHTFRLAHKPFY